MSNENKMPDYSGDTGKFHTVDIGGANRTVPAELGERNFREERNTKDTGDENFIVDFDFDSEYRDRPSDAPIQRSRRKRSGCLGGILYAAFIICVSVIMACLIWLASTDVFGFTKPDSMVEVTVPNNYTMDEIADILHDKGVIKYKWLFKVYASFSHAEEKIGAGTYKINTNYDYRAVVYGITPGSGERIVIEVTIPEGYSLLQTFNLLEEKGVCTADELWNSAANDTFEYDFLDASTLGEKTRLEGYLFPDTYQFYINDDADRVINKFLDNFDNKMTDEYTARASELGYTMTEILTIASMIEREAAYDSERDTIASVIYNRLNSSDFPYLQIDATIWYAIAGTDQEFSTSIDSPYNTYMYGGLPPTPIANPGIASIRAALYPADTAYYYYAKSVEGGHEFFRTYNGFLEFINSDQFSPV